MGISNRLYRTVHSAGVSLGLIPAPASLDSFVLDENVKTRLRSAAAPGIEQTFFDGGRRPIHKWHHYLAIYERYFSVYRNRPLFFLEIGVDNGGSLEMWRRYFGPMATIVGLDINPACVKRVDPENHVRIGSQADPSFLKRVISEFGAPDIILDDGSHIAAHQHISLEVLFPLLKDGGIYAIEDVHTAYWPSYGGGYNRRGSAIEIAKMAIDDLHGWYHNRKAKVIERDRIEAVHVYDSIIVFLKRNRDRPGHLGSN